MKISKFTSVILAAMLTATAVPFNEVSVPYNNFSSYAVEAESEESYEQEIVAEGTLGERIEWTLYDDGYMYIDGEGDMPDFDGANPWGEFADQIINVGFSEKITSIGDYAFCGCENLTDCVLFGSIGAHAFEGCTNFSPNTYSINKPVSEIKDYAFYGTKLDFISIGDPNCIIADSPNVFPANTTIESFINSTAQAYAEKYNKEFGGINGMIAGGTFDENIEWTLYDDGYMYIDGEGDMPDFDGANPWGEFADQIINVGFSEKITSIGDYAFYGCENLTECVLFGSIGAHAFEGCTNFSPNTYFIDNPVSEIKDYAFYGLKLDFIIIEDPECIIADSPNVFPEHTVIHGIEGSTAQAYAEKYGREFVDITSDEQTVVAEGKCGENLTWVLDDNGSLVFSGEGDMDNWASAEDTPWAEYTSMIRTVSMSEEVTSIGDYAFYGCENLVSGALTSVIGAHAYEGCKRMNGYSYYGDVSPINEIRDCAFKGCYSLWAIPIANPDCIIADSEDVFDNNTAIEGYVGSTAHKYAEKYERNFQDITLIENEGSCGENLYWYMTSDGMLGIGGSGEMDNYSEDFTAAPWYSFAEDITSICINDFNTDDDAIALSENCFAMCENAETIYFYNSNCIIADSAETIPENAVIWGYAGSTAQEYAEKYNREFEAIPTTDASGALNEEFTWELNSEGILYITGFGAMDDYTDGNPWGEYADMINSVYFYGNVTSIGKNAFNYCENLEFVDIDESIEFIDMDAFIGCDNLNYINFHGNKKCVIYDSASTIPAQAELIGHFGSPVHEYADAYERSFYWIDGDINEDNSVDSSDASMVLAEYSNIQTGGEAKLSSVETTTADVTNDNVVDAADASSILQYYSKASTGGNPTWD